MQDAKYTKSYDLRQLGGILQGMKRVGTIVAVVTVVLVLTAGCGSTVMAPIPHYTRHLTLRPSSRPQIRTIQFPPDRSECWAIAQVRPNLTDVRCYDTLTLQLSPLTPHGQTRTATASIRQCVARLTNQQLRQGCNQTLQRCNSGTEGCPPGWTAQTIVQFRTNGTQVEKGTIICGNGTFQVFHYHLHWCDAVHGLPPRHLHWLSAGDNYELDIPGVVQIGTEERIAIRPDGALIFQGLPPGAR